MTLVDPEAYRTHHQAPPRLAQHVSLDRSPLWGHLLNSSWLKAEAEVVHSYGYFFNHNINIICNLLKTYGIPN
jgi:hypothetical protein